MGASPCVSQLLLLKDGKALGNLEQSTSLKGIAQSKVTHPVTTATQKPNITPLKRKTTEVCYHQGFKDDTQLLQGCHYKKFMD